MKNPTRIQTAIRVVALGMIAASGVQVWHGKRFDQQKADAAFRWNVAHDEWQETKNNNAMLGMIAAWRDEACADRRRTKYLWQSHDCSDIYGAKSVDQTRAILQQK